MSANATFGSPVRRQRVRCGPSIGWIEVLVSPGRTVIVTGNYVVQRDEAYLLQLAAPATITLPDLNSWLNLQGAGGPIFIKDILGNLSTRNLTIQPVNGQQIDNLSNLVIIENYASVIVRPLSDQSGLFLGWGAF